MLVRYGRNFSRVYFEGAESASRSFSTSQTRDPEKWTTPDCVFEDLYRIFLASLRSRAKQVFLEQSVEFAKKEILVAKNTNTGKKKKTTVGFPACRRNSGRVRSNVWCVRRLICVLKALKTR